MTLVNFTIDKASIEIPQFTLYYFRKEQDGSCRSGYGRKPDHTSNRD